MNFFYEFIQKFQRKIPNAVSRSVVFVFMLGMLAFVTFTLFHTNNIVEEFTAKEYHQQRSTRMVVQIRALTMKSLASCQQLAIDDQLGLDEWTEQCFSSVEASYAQIINDYKDVDVDKIKSELDDIYQVVEQTVAQAKKNRHSNEVRLSLLELHKKITAHFDRLGKTESSMWSQNTSSYSEMLGSFRWANRMTIFSVFLVVIFILYFFALILLKERADQALAKAREDLEEQQLALIQSSKMSALGEMASGIAHEINNPLAVIYTKAEKLQRLNQSNKVTTESTAEIVTIILTMTQRINKIIQSMKGFARDGAHDPFEKANLKHVIEEAVEICKNKLSSANVKFEIEIPNPNLVIECRASQIGQVLVNLIGNAQDAICDLPQEKWIKLLCSESADAISISVMDCGSGIPKEIQEKMFMPFFTTKEVGKGTGIGLSISMGILKAHHGSIRIDSDCPNTCITFTLPKVQSQPELAS